jgi:Asp-tRNA(Asn)/Glu-tRNA(Gln) amidotransferase B subunit
MNKIRHIVLSLEVNKWVLNKEKLDEISARLKPSPWKSFKQFTQKTSVSTSSAQTITKLLKLNYVFQSIHMVKSNPQLISFPRLVFSYTGT